MPDIGFYHLTRSTVEAALPPLLTRTLAAGERAVVRCGSMARLAALDKALWEAEWLPHGTTHAALQPIFLTEADERPNGARFLFLLDGTESEALADYARVFDLFDGGDADAVAAARGRWTARLRLGHALTYWRQGEAGWTKG